MKSFTIAYVAALGTVAIAQDLGALLSSTASQQFQQLSLTGVDGDPCRSDAGQPSYYKCACTQGQDFVLNYLCQNPGSCTPDNIPGLTQILVNFCKSVGVSVTAPQNPRGLSSGGGSSAVSSAGASAATSAASSAAGGAGTPAIHTTPARTTTTRTTSAGSPVSKPASSTGAAAAKNIAGGLAGVAGFAGLLVL